MFDIAVEIDSLRPSYFYIADTIKLIQVGFPVARDGWGICTLLSSTESGSPMSTHSSGHLWGLRSSFNHGSLKGLNLCSSLIPVLWKILYVHI